MNAVFIAILGALSVASAQLDKPWPESPPWEYDYPYRGELSVVYMEPALVHFICTAGFNKTPGVRVPFGATIRACAGTALDGSSCELVLPHKHYYEEKLWWDLYRHEIAHCNGWNH